MRIFTSKAAARRFRIAQRAKSEKFPKGTRVRVVLDLMGGMVDVPVGTEGRVTKGGNVFVGVRFDNGISVGAWMTQDRNGNPTLEVV